MYVFVLSQGINIVHAGWEGKKWQNSVHVVVICPLFLFSQMLFMNLVTFCINAIAICLSFDFIQINSYPCFFQKLSLSRCYPNFIFIKFEENQDQIDQRIGN